MTMWRQSSIAGLSASTGTKKLLQRSRELSFHRENISLPDYFNSLELYGGSRLNFFSEFVVFRSGADAFAKSFLMSGVLHSSSYNNNLNFYYLYKSE